MRSFLTRSWGLLPLLCLVLMSRPVHAGDRPARPNVLVIVADDLGYADLGCQGCKDIPTPNIDSLAKNGVRCTDGYVTCPVCSPTRAGLLTGRYQQRFGHEFNLGTDQGAPNQSGLPLTQRTLADLLKALGYRTGLIGKWHLGFRPEFHPHKRGFDEFFGFLGGAHPYFPGVAGKGNPILRGHEPVDEKEYLTDAFTREAMAFLDRQRKESFLLVLTYNAVHGPMQGPEKYAKQFGHIADAKRRTLAAMHTALDHGVGAVLAKLRDLGLEENTLIFFISDNGGPTAVNASRNLPLRGFKNTLWEGGVRIPFLVQWKGKLPAGQVYTQPVVSLDILATALAAAGGTSDPKRDGVNLVPYLTGKAAGVPHEALYWRYGVQWAVRKGNWKLANADGDVHLADLAADIGETQNLAAQRPEVVKDLKALYQAWNGDLAEPLWRVGKSSKDKKKKKPAPAKAALEGGGAQPATWKAGLAKEIITPEKGVWLAGYGSKRPPDGKLHDLWMKALALEDPSGRRAVLVTSDFQGVPKEMSDRVFAQLHKKLGLERHQVMLTFSHNHCGPRLGSDLVDYYPIEAEQVKLVEEYTVLMEDKMVAMIGAALAKLSPANLQIGEGRTNFAVNRRNNREADVPALLAKGVPLKGPVDHAVPVLTVTRPDKSLAAILFGYACHPTTLSFTKWCGDYPGFAQLELEKNHPGALAMFVNTCGGDQNPLPRRQVELCERYGLMLASAVEEAMKKPLQAVTPGLQTAFAYVDLPYLQVMSREDLKAALAESNAIRERWAERMLQKLDAGEKFPTAYPYPLHAWRLGKEMLVIGMGAETVVDYALRFKTQFGPGTWVCGYADDMIAYIPSRRVWDEGGYEGGSSLYEYGRPALRWAGDIEERIAESVRKLAAAVGK